MASRLDSPNVVSLEIDKWDKLWRLKFIFVLDK